MFGSVNDEDEGYCYTVAEFRALLQAYIDKLTKAQTDLDKAQADYDAKLAAYNAAQDEVAKWDALLKQYQNEKSVNEDALKQATEAYNNAVQELNKAKADLDSKTTAYETAQNAVAESASAVDAAKKISHPANRYPTRKKTHLLLQRQKEISFLTS